MTLHPNVARKAQVEIDVLLNESRTEFPTFGDRQKLPYIECILKEVLR